MTELEKVYLDKRRPCHECSKSLQRISGMYVAAKYVDEFGYTRYAHIDCLLGRAMPEDEEGEET